MLRENFRQKGFGYFFGVLQKDKKKKVILSKQIKKLAKQFEWLPPLSLQCCQDGNFIKCDTFKF